jgi:hypothetical protein
MGVEDAAEHDVHEEAFGGILRLGQVPVFKVGADDAGVVGPVPSLCGGVVGERHPVVHRP